MNFITGSGDVIGKAIVESQDVAGIVFMDLKEVGYGMIKQSSNLNPRPIIAEMGGKNPVIVTENANIEKAVNGIVIVAFGYSGQKWSACSRLYVSRKVKPVFMDKLVQIPKACPSEIQLNQMFFQAHLSIKRLMKNIRN